MSHQDSTNRRTSCMHWEEIFEFLLPSSLDDSIRHGNASVSCRTLAAMAMVCWGWSDRRTLSQRMEEASGVVSCLFPQAQTASRQGVCQALRTCGRQIQQAILQQLKERLPRLKGCWTTAGRPTFAVDGTLFSAPRTAQNQEQFAGATPNRPSQTKRSRKSRYKSKSDAGKAMSVQVQTTLCWHVGTGMPACWQLAPSHQSERQAAIDLLQELPPKARIVADAEYVGRPLWSAIIQSKRSFVIRVGSNISLLRKLDPSLKHDIERVYHWPQKVQSKRQPPLMLRLVAVITPRGWMYLLTNEWDLSSHQIAELYQARWGVEVFFRTVKQSCEKAKLQCRTPDNVLTELSWTLLAIWASLFVAKWQLHGERTPLHRLSPLQVIDLFRESLRQLLAGQTLRGPLDFTTCLKADESGRQTSKQNRKYPRKKEPPSCGAPKVKDATAEQILIAKELL